MVYHSLPSCSISSKFWTYVNCHVGVRRIHQDHQFHPVPGPGIGSKSISTTPEAWLSGDLNGSHGPWLSLVQPWSYPRILHPKAAGCGARERASSGHAAKRCETRNNVSMGEKWAAWCKLHSRHGGNVLQLWRIYQLALWMWPMGSMVLTCL